MMKQKITTVLLSFLCFSFITNHDFKTEQLKYSHVRTAYTEKWSEVKAKLHRAGIDTNHFEIFIRVFKQKEKWKYGEGRTTQARLV